MKQITNFIGEISDEFKIVVVDAIRTLCLKFPQKHRTLLNFLSSVLRDEGGFEYKKAIVETILTIIKEIPESKEAGLTHLCEFIEDCEFTYLSTKILHLLGKEGPSTSVPSRYIRYIYNRISLENASVRASAVSALAKFGVKLDTLRPSIITLLRRCKFDNDDEVRDRATFYLSLLENDTDAATKYISTEFFVPMVNLERALQEYQQHSSVEPFNISKVPIAVAAKEAPSKKSSAPGAPSAASTAAVSTPTPPKPVEESQELYAALLASLPQFANIGNLFQSSKPVELTESETEYVVHCIKHIFPQHIVLQYNVTNTLKEQLLENLTVKVDTTAMKGAKVEVLIPSESLPFNTPGTTYVGIRRADAVSLGSLQNTLKFTVKEIDQSGEADTTGYDDEYQIEDIEIATSDYVQKTFVANFQEKWDELGETFEVVEKYSLTTLKSIQDAVKEVADYLGMQPCERTDQVPAKRTKHILLLSGSFIGGVPVLVRARMKAAEGAGVLVELAVRSGSADVSSLVASAM